MRAGHAKIRADLVGQRLLDLHIALVRSRTRGAAVADRRHKVGGALSAGAVAGEQPIRRLVGDLLTAAVELGRHRRRMLAVCPSSEF